MLKAPSATTMTTDAVAAAPRKSKRLPTLDILRGFLMCLLIWTHTAHNLAPDAVPRPVHLALRYLLGTVGFTTVSGMLIGYFLVCKATDMARVYARYRSQSLRLLMVAHPIIVIGLAGPFADGRPWWEFGLRTLVITDVLALLFLFVVPHLNKLAPHARLALGVVAIVASRGFYLVPVKARPLILLRDFVSGVGEDSVLVSTYAFGAMLGFFLIGSFIGHLFAVAEKAGTLATLSKRLVPGRRRLVRPGGRPGRSVVARPLPPAGAVGARGPHLPVSRLSLHAVPDLPRHRDARHGIPGPAPVGQPHRAGVRGVRQDLAVHLRRAVLRGADPALGARPRPAHEPPAGDLLVPGVARGDLGDGQRLEHLRQEGVSYSVGRVHPCELKVT